MNKIGTGFQVVGQEAIMATFTRIKNVYDLKWIIINSRIYKDMTKTHWVSFIRKGQQGETPEEFSIIMEDIWGFLPPIALATEQRDSFESEWPPGGYWKKIEGIN